MARGRMISKVLSTSERYAKLYEVAGELAEFCQATYPLLVAHSDDFGRLQGDLHTIKTLVIPGSSRTFPEVQDMLIGLHRVGLIQWYQAEDGKKYIQINNFERHQVGLHKRTASRFPGDSGKFPELQGDSHPRELKGREGKGTEEKGREVRTEKAGGADAADFHIANCGNVENSLSSQKNVQAEPETRCFLPTQGQLLKLVHGVLDEDPAGEFVDWKEAVKARCARLGFNYDAETVGKALESALAYRAVKQGSHAG